MIELVLIALFIIIIDILTLMFNQVLLIMVSTLMVIIFAVNYMVLFKTPSEYVSYYTPLFWTALSYLIFNYLGLDSLLQDLSLIILFFTLTVLFWDTPVLRGLFTYATPPLILLSAFISSLVGCSTPARFVLLALMDSLAGRSLASLHGYQPRVLFSQALFAAALSLSPVFYVSNTFLIYNITASIIKVVLYLKDFKKIDYIAIDVVFKITIPGVFV
ncbi:MAG: hypothetical protein QXH84_03560 [Thermosphaera sp.]